MKSLSVVMLALSTILSACAVEVNGHKVAGIGDANNKKYSYELSNNGCSTGKKEFDSQDSMCSTLQSDSENNNCARSMRADFFNSNCSGSFTPRA